VAPEIQTYQHTEAIMSEAANPFCRQSIGEIAAQLPGASGVFRRFGIYFCCPGRVRMVIPKYTPV